MKAKPNWNELEAHLDFASIDEKLRNLVTSGGLKRRKRSADLLDKVKEALIHARSSGVSIAALAAFLEENGLPVSEPTLRHYLREQGVSKGMRRKRTNSRSERPPAPNAPVPTRAELHTTLTTAAVSSFRTRPRGPRIADARNL